MTTTKKTIKIFLADDDDDDRMLFSDALSKLPLNCEISNFKDGIYLMGQLMVKETKLPDIVFLDINMPLMDGSACLKKIRDTERICKLPVIIYSTSFVKEEIEKYRDMGANCYLPKPASFNQLKTLLYKCISPYCYGTVDQGDGSFIIEL